MQKIKNQDLGRKTIEEFRQSEKTRIIIVLDNVRSLNNVGSAFRTADAFLLESIYLCGVTGQPPNKEIEKTALGATDTVSWRYFKTTAEAISDLMAKGFRVYSVEQVRNSTPLQKFEYDPKQPLALVFGNEVYGVEEEIIKLCNGSVEIPQLGTKHSLNISVSVGIVVWELIRKHLR